MFDDSSSFPSGTAAMYVDLRRCIGCNSCSLACKQEFNVGIGELWTQIYGAERGDYPSPTVQVLPMRCQQCAQAPCMSKCTSLGYNAIKRQANGIVWIDTSKCVGCGQCVPVCPYKAMNFNPDKANPLSKTGKGVAEKCEFCRQRLDQGLLPACVITCLGITLESGDFNTLRNKYPNATQMGENGVKILYGNLGEEPSRPTNGYPNPVPCHND